MTCYKCKEAPRERGSYCAPCKRKIDRDWFQKHKKVVQPKRAIQRRKIKNEIYNSLRAHCKDNPCEICGEDDYVVLEFDHLDRATKKASISDMIRHYYGIEAIMEEVKKCRVLCCNCHRRHTAQQMGWYKVD